MLEGVDVLLVTLMCIVYWIGRRYLDPKQRILAVKRMNVEKELKMFARGNGPLCF